MGKTTVFINDSLINEALKVSNLKTKKEVIEAALRELVKKKPGTVKKRAWVV